jgi:transposase-like protein
MGQILHGCAITTEAVRRAIQNSQESLRALAKRYGINQKTVAKWKQRETVADLPTGPKEAKPSRAIRLPCRRCSPNGFTRSPERHTEGEIT